jgi:hypothetical protein
VLSVSIFTTTQIYNKQVSVNMDYITIKELLPVLLDVLQVNFVKLCPLDPSSLSDRKSKSKGISENFP